MGHFRAPYLKLSDKVIDYLVNTMHYEVWGSIVGGNTDWMEWELPQSEASRFSAPMARAVQEAMYSQRKGDTFSTVLCLHDRPHELLNIKRVVSDICEVCPKC